MIGGILRYEGEVRGQSCSVGFRDETAPPVAMLYDHGILKGSKENADAEQERKADTSDRHF